MSTHQWRLQNRIKIFVLLVVLATNATHVHCATFNQDLFVGSMTSSTGIRVLGPSAGMNFGQVVSTAGDMNGDQIGDLLVTAPSFLSNTGIVYVLFGMENMQFGAFSFDLATDFVTGPTSGFTIMGAVISAKTGQAACRAGDINHDGIDDILIGAPGLNSGGGAVYVIFGRNVTGGAQAFGNINLGSFSAADGFTIYGAANGDATGVAVAPAGDVNGDGVDDILIGANQADPPGLSPSSNAGACYVVFGRDVVQTGIPFADYNLGVLNPSTGFGILGAALGDTLGRSVAGVGDVNGDSVDDIVLAAPVAISGVGAVYIVYGRNINAGGAAFQTIDLLTLTADVGVRIQGASSGDAFGGAASTPGDVNGDGVQDIIVGARTAEVAGESSSYNSGVTYVMYGRNKLKTPFANAGIGAVLADASQGFRIIGAAVGDQSGYAVSTAGDINGDGVDDIMTSAISAELDASVAGMGFAYVIFGRRGAAPFGDVLLSTIITGSMEGFRIGGALGGDQLGFSVSAAGDVNKDGAADIVVGAAFADPPASGGGTRLNAGIAYVIFGTPLIPSSQPSAQPLAMPTSQPSSDPTSSPSAQPSTQPTSAPTARQTTMPSSQPSSHPSSWPSAQPTGMPSTQPSAQPTVLPTTQPSTQPSIQPSMQPSTEPTGRPSGQPSSQPSLPPSTQPSAQPSSRPSTQPSSQPSVRPSAVPISQPSGKPSAQPSSLPSCQPSCMPSSQPCTIPTTHPSTRPTAQPSRTPSSQPSALPSMQPTRKPSSNPSSQPSTQPTTLPSTQSTSQPTSKPSFCPSVHPSAQPSDVASEEPTANPTYAPSLRISGSPSVTFSDRPTPQPSPVATELPPTPLPTSLPSAQMGLTAAPSVAPTHHQSVPPSTSSTSEWVSVLTGADEMNSVARIGDSVWGCAPTVANGATSMCTTLSARTGAVEANYGFHWNRLIAALTISVKGTLMLLGHFKFPFSTSSEIAQCHIVDGRLECSVKSFADTRFVAASFLPYPNRILSIGTYNVYVSGTIIDITPDTVRSFIYTLFNMKAVVLSQVQSPPNFVGSFVAGTAVQSVGEQSTHIVAGMLRTDSGQLSMMSIVPTNGDISTSVDLVTSTALESTGPDLFIVGGLKLSDGGVGKHAYLLRVNALYNTVMYCVRYRASDDEVSSEHRRALTSTNVLSSVARGVVHVNGYLYLIMDCIRPNSTSLTVLRTRANDGAILHQVHVSSPEESMRCADITLSELQLIISCTVQRNESGKRSVIISVDRELTFSVLPEGFIRDNTSLFHSEFVPFKRAIVSVTTTSTKTASTSYQLNTTDQVPSTRPSVTPSSQPSGQPSSAPTVSANPTSTPSTSGPTNTHKPSAIPTARPSAHPSVKLTARPTDKPSERPTSQPFLTPTCRPTPTTYPTRAPPRTPSAAPIHTPSVLPTLEPTSDNKGDTDRSTVIWSAVGGALLLCVCGYVWYQYKLHWKEENAKAKRKVEYFAHQKILVAALEKEREEMIQQIRLEDARKEKNRRKQRANAGAYSSLPDRPPSPLNARSRSDSQHSCSDSSVASSLSVVAEVPPTSFFNNDSSSCNISSLHSSERDFADYQ